MNQHTPIMIYVEIGEAPVEARKIAVTESRIDELARKDATVAAIVYVLLPTAFSSTAQHWTVCLCTTEHTASKARYSHRITRRKKYR
jgi:hypothetical protein